MDASDRIIIAADELDLEQTLRLAETIGKRVYAFKIHNLYDLHGPSVVERLRRTGAQRVWVDAKLHDIPNTVRLRAKAIAASGADIVSVHACGGINMMQAALESGLQTYAITILTSLDEAQVENLYYRRPATAVLEFAMLAMLAKAHGVVCSPKELESLARSEDIIRGLKFVVPGIRSAGKGTDDQKRTDTPVAALKAGANYLVIGRQITKAADPVAAFEELAKEIADA